jgi:creatinine amidohydrolase/Fe(II)-dependent formamide hydrolase-like protein
VQQNNLFNHTGDTITGRPSQASAEKGRAYHDNLVGRLIQVLDMMKKSSLS